MRKQKQNVWLDTGKDSSKLIGLQVVRALSTTQRKSKRPCWSSRQSGELRTNWRGKETLLHAASLCPRKRDPKFIFSADHLVSPVMWTYALFLYRGDVDTNLEPTRDATGTDTIYMYALCATVSTKRQHTRLFNHTASHWIHLNCAGIKINPYNINFKDRNFTKSLNSTQNRQAQWPIQRISQLNQDNHKLNINPNRAAPQTAHK